ncbi:MAG TPA: hypothetical protein VJY62_07590, partial [Bacteroidia bacterium]|nr:hypothetical protein [Bacteroidia bacterium]
QEVSYLLQRIEDYNGLIILATNMKNNIDDAFIRRFNAMLKFPFPDAAERTEIWINSFPENSLFLEEIVTGHEKKIEKKYLERKPFCDKLKKYELTGGNIINVIHYASLKAIERVHHEKNAITQKKENISEPSGNSNKFQGQLKSKIEEPRFTIYLTDVSDGIKREMIKEGKPFQG